MKGKIFLKRGKDKPLRNHHPWIFSGAIARIEDASDGDTVEVYDAAGEWLARAAYNSRSQIAARVWTFNPGEEIEKAFFKRRLEKAAALREKSLQDAGRNAGMFDVPTFSAYRLVNAESDGLPGLVVDRYGDYCVAQFLTLGVELHKPEIVECLVELFRGGGPERSLRGIYERSDVDVRAREGLPETTGVLFGDAPPDKIEIVEDGLHFWVDVNHGHKTGFYLDQSENRRRAAPYLHGEVLNAFAYTGGFGVYAARFNNARVTNLDASAAALELARENFRINELETNGEYLVGDAFQILRELRANGRQFDAIVLDPPKFVFSQGQMQRGLRGYKDLNLLAFQLLRPNGSLVTFSCSGLVSPDLFQKVVFGAMIDIDASIHPPARSPRSLIAHHRDGQIVEKLSQAPDHPIALAFPEAEYLKGLIVKVG